jgi:hypothetical protein
MAQLGIARSRLFLLAISRFDLGSANRPNELLISSSSLSPALVKLTGCSFERLFRDFRAIQKLEMNWRSKCTLSLDLFFFSDQLKHNRV